MMGEEIGNGFGEGPFTKKEILEKLGVGQADIAVGGLGLILEDETTCKWRLVYDATISGVNPKVVLPERTELPGIQDLMGILASDIVGEKVVGVKIDIKSAFKRIMPRQSEYGKNIVVVNGK